MKVNKILFVFMVLFAIIGVALCLPALLPILVLVGAVALLVSPIVVIVQKGKIKKLTIEISKKKD